MEPKFAALLDKYRAGTIDPDERALLAAELELPERVAELEALIDSEFRNDGVGGLSSPPQGDAIFQRLMQEIRGGLRESKSTIPLHSPNRWRWAAAAVIVLIVGAGTYFWIKNEHKKAAIAGNVFKNDVAPGGNHAVLTLANGARIKLDSVTTADLGTQGGAHVTQTSAGSVAYRKAAKGQYAVFNTIATPAGGQYQVVLGDGTRVWLNALSTLKFPTAFSGHERSVQLTGEAYFEVSKDKKKPFHVNANGIDVEVLGTHFNVNAYPDETTVKTTLLEGKVKLVKAGANILLEPGEQGQTDGTSGFVLVKNADVDQAVAWKNGFFSFEDANIQTVMRQLERWYGIKVQYEGKPVQGSFEGKMGRDLNLTQVLTGLSKSEVHFHLEGTTLTVLP